MDDRRTQILEAAGRVIARRGVRGLRVEELAREAGVSVALVYYYFENRAGLLRRVLEFVDERAGTYTAPRSRRTLDPAGELAEALAGEIQDDPAVRENSAVWGELRAAAWFDEAVREAFSRLSEDWIGWVAGRIRRGQAGGEIPAAVDPQAAAERLTALVEGVSGRWLAGDITTAHGQRLIRAGVGRELGATTPV